MATYNTLIKRYIGNNNWDIIYPKTTAENIIDGTLDAARIPGLSAKKITYDQFDVDRIPNLSANKITSDVLDAAIIPGLDASKIISGTISKSFLPSIVLTSVIYREKATLASFVATEYSTAEGRGNLAQEGDVFISGIDHKTYIHNGGTAWSALDFTLMESPLDKVTTVNGQSGTVILTKADISDLTNVDNTSDVNKPVSTAQQAALDGKANKVSIASATKTKITYNSQGIVTAGGTLIPSDIPDLSAKKITSDQFADTLIPMLATSKITGLDTALSQLNSRKQRMIEVVNDVAMNPDPAWAPGDIAFEY